MKQISSYILVGFTLSALLLASCSKPKPKGGRTDTYTSGTISFASDESFSPIVDEEVAVFEHTYPDAHLKPIYTNELDGVNMLLNGKVCVMVASRDFKPKELEALRSNKFMPKSFVLAYDALALIQNKSNTDSCITVNDFKKILSGKITKWSQLYPGSKKGDILVCFDNKQSSTVHWCVDSLLGGKPINSPNIMAGKTSKEVIDYVEQTPGAIGIIGSNWLDDKRDTTNTTFNKNIRVMSVSRMAKATPMNSWKPYQYYIYNANYPLIRKIWALVNDPLNALPWNFANFMRGPKGQLIIFKSGLLPIEGDLEVRDVNVNNE